MFADLHTKATDKHQNFHYTLSYAYHTKRLIVDPSCASD